MTAAPTLQYYGVDEGAQRADCSDDERDRQRVPGGDRQQRPQHGRTALALQTERHGEQRADRRIDSVKGAHPGERLSHGHAAVTAGDAGHVRSTPRHCAGHG